jgi:hypothetical protein
MKWRKTKTKAGSFTYAGNKTISKQFFKHTNLKITFTTTNTIQYQLKHKLPILHGKHNNSKISEHNSRHLTKSLLQGNNTGLRNY